MSPGLRIQDPLLVELHVLAELEAVFVRKWVPRFCATLDDGHARETLGLIAEETNAVLDDAHEALSNWVRIDAERVHMHGTAMDFSREAFLRNLALFKATSATVFARAAQTAPSPALAERLRACARREEAHAEMLQALLD